MEFISINYLAVLVAGCAGMMVGYVWYGPLFGKAWIGLIGFTEAQMKAAREKGMGTSYALALIGSIIVAYVIAMFVELFGAVDALSAFQVIFWPWLGFIAVSSLSSVLWEGRSWRLYLLTTSYYLVSYFIQALIVTYWA